MLVNNDDHVAASLNLMPILAYSLLDSINKIIKLTSWHVKYQTLALSIVRFQF